ncbi:alpha/beta fold hydrolase [Streptomyces indicus]|uniref:Lysophospholipase, alpha-beta hydrolase superfamily n=1 Tax=Streptomyces indicus TaxID=417292 RepID=A0A1G8U3N4_9ACTN|nr:alpha/beta hydrolase [Streptomyces indicus]SDJ48388.1 Lysophospholipase, alpha-beta hydrolase superfamily [Streptomyces indicus]
MTHTTPYTTQSVTAPDGLQIAAYTWLPDGGRPRALVQIAHGAAEHAQRYDRFARYLTAHGYGVIASDHRGHGATAISTGGYGVTEAPGAENSEADGAGADSWRAIVDDLKAVGDRARELFPDAPTVLLGHSMGSMLARDYAQEYPDTLAALLLSGTFRTLPGVEIQSSLDRLDREIAEGGRAAVSSFVPEVFASFNDPYPHRTGFEWLSRDESEVDRYVADERCGFAFSAGLSRDWVNGIRKINHPDQLARIPDDLPVHVAVGTKDPCNQGMSLVYDLLEDFRYVGVADLTWKGYEDARHEILNETNRAEVQADLVAWLEKRV